MRLLPLLANVELNEESTASYRAIRLTLQDQLAIIYDDGNDAESSDSERTEGLSPPGSDSDAATGDARNDEGEGATTADVVEESEPVDEPVEPVESKEPEVEPEPTADCCACGDQKPENDTVKLDCSHVYCYGCVTELFDHSVHKDSSLFPPRCCKETTPLYLDMQSLENCRSILPAELLAEVEAKKAEYDEAQATFCSGTKCGQLVLDKNIVGGVANCSICSTKTCSTCKGEAHEGLCPTDDDTKLLMATAGKVMWQQCSRCKNMVELDTGCFHIVCRCQYQFCYMCGKPWKSCPCPQFDEQHLLRPTPSDALEVASVVC